MAQDELKEFMEAFEKKASDRLDAITIDRLANLLNKKSPTLKGEELWSIQAHREAKRFETATEAGIPFSHPRISATLYEDFSDPIRYGLQTSQLMQGKRHYEFYDFGTKQEIEDLENLLEI